MWAFPQGWLVFSTYSAFCGALIGFAGHHPSAGPEPAGPAYRLACAAGLPTALTVLAVLLSPVLVRVNAGGWDRRRARAEAVQLGVGSVPVVALLLAGAGACQLAVAASGGWPGGWGTVPVAAVVGAVTGAAVGVPALLAGTRLKAALGLPDQDTEPRTAPDVGR
jgi:hypothetical protein